MVAPVDHGLVSVASQLCCLGKSVSHCGVGAANRMRVGQGDRLHRLAVASGRFRTVVLVLGYCGLRFGEAAALRCADVNCRRGASG